MKNEPYGVRGWLALFCFTLIAGPVSHLILSANLARSMTDPAELFGLWLAVGTKFALDLPALYKMMKVYKPSSVKFAVWVLWIGGPGLAFLDLAVDLVDEQFAKRLLWQILIAGVWTLYLLNSKRVRNTYV
jgi:hypothetical protein